MEEREGGHGMGEGWQGDLGWMMRRAGSAVQVQVQPHFAGRERPKEGRQNKMYTGVVWGKKVVYCNY